MRQTKHTAEGSATRDDVGENQIADLAQALVEARNQLSEMRAEADAAVASREQAEADILRLRAELQAVFHSTSWRVVGILRRIAHILPAQLRRSALGTLQRVGRRTMRLQSSKPERPRGTDASGFVVPAGAADLVRDSGLFDPDWYSASNPAARDSSDAFSHFIEHGLKQNINPNSLFDARWYLETYPDVEAAGANPLLHFIQWGHLEERKPSLGFDCHWYKAKYSDAVAVGENCLAHYLRVGRKQGLLPLDPDAEYSAKIRDEDQLFALERPELESHARSFIFPIRFLILVAARKKDEFLRTSESLDSQLYRNFVLIEEACELTELSATPMDFFIWMHAGDTLHARALYEFASALNANINLDLIYCDTDMATLLGRSDPFCKPDWSPDYLESMNYIGCACCFRASLSVSIISNASCQYDLLLKFTEQPREIAHVRKFLYHEFKVENLEAIALDREKEVLALEGRLSRTGRVGKIETISYDHGVFELKINLRSSPLVSVVVSSSAFGREEDEGARLETFVRSLFEGSIYKNLQLVVVTESKLSIDRLAALEARGCTVVNCESKFSPFERQKIGVRAARGKLVLLSGYNLQPTNSDWIERMVQHFEKPHVGAVGTKLMNPDGTVKSAGIVFDHGNPIDVSSNQRADALGYHFSACAVRNYSAVSEACIMTYTDTFRNIYHDTELSYFGAEFCARIRASGFSVVYEPRAVLVESYPLSDQAQFGMHNRDHLVGYATEYDPFDNLTISRHYTTHEAEIS
jgi:O-antigen biosynthesis protein